jgi:hypothetical protein
MILVNLKGGIMKNFSFLILILLVLADFSYTQTWSEQTSGVTTQLTSISAVNDSVVWVCGYSGRVLRTTNGGMNWVSVNSAPIPTTLDLHNVFALDANIAMVCGSGTTAYVFRTSNGGANWTQVFSQTGGFFNGIWMLTNQAGLLVGDPVGGRWSMFKTLDGGLSWDSAGQYLQQNGSEAGWNNALFLDPIGGIWFGTNNSRIYFTPNGVNWLSESTGGQINSYAVWFNTATKGMTGGNASLITTTAGLVWLPTIGTLPGTANVGGITGNNSNWWIVRQSTAIYYSSNDGVSWALQYTAPAGNYRHISKPRSTTFTRLWAVRSNGGISKCEVLVGVSPLLDEVPEKYGLEQNYPNPFNPATTIKFDLPAIGKPVNVTLIVFDALGREVAKLVDQALSPGSYEAVWNASDFTSGVYYYQLRAGDFVETRKMMLVK